MLHPPSGSLLRRLGSRRRLWLVLASLLLSTIVATFTVLWRRQTAVQIGIVPVQHFKDALDDVVTKQPQLCKELGQLQKHLASSARRGSRPATDLAEPTLQPSNTMQPVLHLQAQGVVLTSYFVGSTDPIYQSNPGRHKVGDFGYMDLWYRTAVALALPAVVFHNGLDAAFTERWTTDTVKFVRVALAEGFYSVNDARFPVFFDWIQCCAHVDHVLVTDLRDVRFARDPFHLFQALREYDLFINTDRNNAWMAERFQEVGYERPKYSVILNAGVFGGRKSAMLDLIQEMLREFIQVYKTLLAAGNSHISNIDMAVLNQVVLNTACKRWRIFTGSPFVAGQVQCELFFECQYHVTHKWIQPGELPPCPSLATGLDLDRQILASTSERNLSRPVWKTVYA